MSKGVLVVWLRSIKCLSTEFNIITQKWLLSLNIKKCKVVSYGRNVDKSHTYKLADTSNQDTTLERGEK